MKKDKYFIVFLIRAVFFAANLFSQKIRVNFAKGSG